MIAKIVNVIKKMLNKIDHGQMKAIFKILKGDKKFFLCANFKSSSWFFYLLQLEKLSHKKNLLLIHNFNIEYIRSTKFII